MKLKAMASPSDFQRVAILAKLAAFLALSAQQQPQNLVLSLVGEIKNLER